MVLQRLAAGALGTRPRPAQEAARSCQKGMPRTPQGQRKRTVLAWPITASRLIGAAAYNRLCIVGGGGIFDPHAWAGSGRGPSIRPIWDKRFGAASSRWTGAGFVCALGERAVGESDAYCFSAAADGCRSAVSAERRLRHSAHEQCSATAACGRRSPGSAANQHGYDRRAAACQRRASPRRGSLGSDHLHRRRAHAAHQHHQRSAWRHSHLAHHRQAQRSGAGASLRPAHPGRCLRAASSKLRHGPCQRRRAADE